jgi:hypothetical protein
VITSWRSNQIQELADQNMKGAFDPKEFSKLVELSLFCVMKRGSERPSMTQVVQMLQEFRLDQFNIESSKGHESNNDHFIYVRPTIPLEYSFGSNSTSNVIDATSPLNLSMSNSLSTGSYIVKVLDHSLIMQSSP